MKKLFHLANCFRRQIPIYCISTLSISFRNYIITFFGARFSAQIIQLAENNTFSMVSITIVHFIILILLFCLIDSLMIYLNKTAIQHIALLLRSEAFKNVLHANYFSLRAIGDREAVLSRMNADITLFANQLGNVFPLMTVISGVSSTVFIMNYPGGWLILLMVYIIAAAAALLQQYLRKKLKYQTITTQQARKELTTIYMFICAHMESIRISLNQSSAMTFFSQKNQNWNQSALKMGIIKTWNSITTQLFQLLPYCFVFMIGYYYYVKGLFTIADIVLIAPQAALIVVMFTSAGNFLTAITQMNIAAARMEDLLNIPGEQSKSNNASIKGAISEIKADNLSVPYPNGKVILIPDHKISYGETIALIGASGSGKSTYGKCLVKLCPYQGHCRINGLELSALNLIQWRECVSYVPQTVFLISGTLRQNLLLGVQQNYSDKQIHSILHSLKAESLISKEGGLDQKLDIDRIDLSGGEAQMIAVARTILQNRSLIIFDETLSAVDRIRKKAVMQAVRKMPGIKIFITHDNEIMKNCDRSILFSLQN